MVCLVIVQLSTSAQESDSSKAREYLIKANKYAFVNPDSAVFYGRKAREITQHFDSAVIDVVALLELGNNLGRSRSYSDAMAMFQAVQKHPAALPKHHVAALINMSVVYSQNMDDLLTSIRLLLTALDIAERENLKHSLVSISNNLGSHLAEIGDFSNAEIYFKKGLEIGSEPRIVANIYYNLANIYFDAGDNVQATDYNQKALKIWNEGSYQNLKVNAFILFVQIFADDNPDRARTYLDSLTAMTQEITDEFLLVRVSEIRGDFFLKTGNCSGAVDDFKRCLTFYEKLKNPSFEIDILGYLLKSYRCLNDTAQIVKTALQVYDAEEKQKQEIDEQLKEQVANLIEDHKALEKTEASLGQMEEKATTTMNKLFLVVVLLGIAVLSLVFIWTLVRQKMKINSVLRSANSEKEELLGELEKMNLSLREANQKVLDMNLHLEKTVEERTMEIQKKNEKISDFVYWNAHGLRGALVNVMGLLDLLRKWNEEEERDASERKELIDLFQRSIQKLDNTVRKFNDELS